MKYLKNNPVSFFLGLAAILFIAAGLTACSSNNTAEVPAQTEEYTVVKFHKDTCGTCKKMDAYLPEVEQALSKKPVNFTTFDFTSEDAKSQTAAMAKAKGLDKALEAHSGSGFLVVIDKDGNPVKKLSGKEYDKAGMIKEIESLVQ